MTSANTDIATQVDSSRHTPDWHAARKQARHDRHRRAPRAQRRADGELPGQLGLFDTTDEEGNR